MRLAIYRLHTWLGLIVALPLLAWTSSGLIYAWPNTVEGGEIESIAPANVSIMPGDAIHRAEQFAGRNLPITALTLLMRNGRPVYQAIGGMGADSLLIDAQTGEVLKTPPPGILTRYFRQAHFYFFAGSMQVPLLVTVSALAFLAALTGTYLNIVLWVTKIRKRTSSKRT